MKGLQNIGLILVSAATLFAAEAEKAERLAVEKCGACHLMGAITKDKLDNMKAPPYWAIAKKANERYDSKEKKIQYIVEYTLDPSEERMLFPKETKDRFGVMPSQKDKVTEEEIKIISEYILEKKF